MENKKKRQRIENRQPSLAVSLSIIVFFLGLFLLQLIVKGETDIHMTLVMASVFATIVLVAQGTTLKRIEEGVAHGCGIATIPMMILMFIGIMTPAWTAAGTTPALIYYGLQIISPTFFLFTATALCALACLVTGTSWGTGATFGIALMGIGHGLGIPAEWTAGAVISGCMFGDTISPISDITNLSSATCEVNIFRHMKGMLAITVPAIVISLLFGLFMGFRYKDNNYEPAQVEAILEGIRNSFHVDPIHAIISLIPLILVLTMAIKKFSALPTMAVSAISAFIIAMLTQGYNLYTMFSFMDYGFVIETGNADLDSLFNRGGLQSVMWTVSLAFFGLSFGGILEKSGVLETLLYGAQAITKNARNLVITHIFTGIGTILLTASPYVSVLLPGRMFISGYDKLGISRTVASRSCTVSGICIDYLAPWTLSGVYFSGILGVSCMSYAPFSIYAWLAPILAILFAIFGIFMFKADPSERIIPDEDAAVTSDEPAAASGDENNE